VQDGVAVAGLDAFAFAAVVPDEGGPGADYGKEDGPVAGGEL
jgi:hypothetical protein